jgi:hypothetical protein
VHSYLRVRNIPIPVPLVDNSTSNGMDLRPKTLIALKRKPPEDYARLLEVFSFVDAQLISENINGAMESTNRWAIRICR